MPPKCSFNAAGRSQATAVSSYGHLAGESSSCFTSLNPEHNGLTIFGGSGRSEFSVSSSSPAEPMGAARGGYGSLSSAAAVNAAVVRDCGCSSSISVAENTPQRRGAYGGLGAGPPGRGLQRTPTYARLDRQASRPKSLATFNHSNDLELSEEQTDHERPQSARAASRSWSLTGGTREASFKKRAVVLPADHSADPAEPKAHHKRAVGFAAVLSMSGWDEHAAEEVDVAAVQPEGASELRGEVASSEAANRVDSRRITHTNDGKSFARRKPTDSMIAQDGKAVGTPT